MKPSPNDMGTEIDLDANVFRVIGDIQSHPKSPQDIPREIQLSQLSKIRHVRTEEGSVYTSLIYRSSSALEHSA